MPVLEFMATHDSVYKELLGEWRRDQLCAARLHPHMKDSQDRLRATKVSFRRTMKVLDAAYQLQVDPTVSAEIARPVTSWVPFTGCNTGYTSS